VWPRATAQDSAAIELLIVAQSIKWHESFLFHTSETAVNWCQTSKTIGVGSYLADYVLDHFLSAHGDQYHLLAVAAYLLKKTRDYIDGCGKESCIYLFCRDGEVIGLVENEIQEIESVLVSFDEVVKNVFHAITDRSKKWITLDKVLPEFHDVEDAMKKMVEGKEKRAAEIAAMWKKAGNESF
jgi:hypothetical protein